MEEDPQAVDQEVRQAGAHQVVEEEARQEAEKPSPQLPLDQQQEVEES